MNTPKMPASSVSSLLLQIYFAKSNTFKFLLAFDLLRVLIMVFLFVNIFFRSPAAALVLHLDRLPYCDLLQLQNLALPSWSLLARRPLRDAPHAILSLCAEEIKQMFRKLHTTETATGAPPLWMARQGETRGPVSANTPRNPRASVPIASRQPANQHLGSINPAKLSDNANNNYLRSLPEA